MTVTVVVLPLALVALIYVGGEEVTLAVGATVSTRNVVRLGLATRATPLISVTWSGTKLTVYVPCGLAPQVPDGAVIV